MRLIWSLWSCELSMKVDDEDLSLGIVGSTARVGWAEAAKSLAEVGGDELVMGEFGNAEDSELTW